MSESELKKRIREKFTILPKNIPPSFSSNPIVIGDTMISQGLDDILDDARKEFPQPMKIPQPCKDGTAHIEFSIDENEYKAWFLKWFGDSK